MKRSALVFAAVLAVASIALKLANPPLPENFSLFYALALFCGCFLRGPIAWALPVVALLFSDIAGQMMDDVQLGVYHVLAMAINYVGFAAMTGIGCFLRKDQNLFRVAGASLVGAGAFYLISNFGAFLDPRMGHLNTPGGLLKCYIDAIPFARGTFVSSLLFSLTAFAFYKVWNTALASSTENVFAAEKQR